MQKTRELISTVLDGETDEVPSTRVGEMVAQDDTREVWARYQMIGEVLREDNGKGQRPSTQFDIAGPLRRQIENEPTVIAPRSAAGARRASLVRPAAGLAIAASVAALAVLAVRGPDPVGPAPLEQLSVASMDTAGEVLDRVAAVEPPAAGLEQVSETAEESELEIDLIEHQRRLNSYLVNFNEQRSSLGVPGVNPYVRIVGFENE